MEKGYRPRYTTLLNTGLLQHPLRAWFFIKPKHANKVKELLEQLWHVNNAYKTKEGFVAEFIARDMEELESFQTQLQPHADYQLVHVIKTIKEEAMFGD